MEETTKEHRVGELKCAELEWTTKEHRVGELRRAELEKPTMEHRVEPRLRVGGGYSGAQC